MPRYRTLNNDGYINVDGARVWAGDDGWFDVESGSRVEAALLAGGAVTDTPNTQPTTASDTGSISGGTTLTAATRYYHDKWVVNGGGNVPLAEDVASSGLTLAFEAGVNQPAFTLSFLGGVTVIQENGTTLNSAEADGGLVIVTCQSVAPVVWRVASGAQAPRGALPAIGKPLALAITSGATASNGTVSYVKRVGPNGKLLSGVRFTSNGGAVTSGSVDLPLFASTVPGGSVSFLIYSEMPGLMNEAVGVTAYIGDTAFSNFFSSNFTLSRNGWYEYTPGAVGSPTARKWAATGSPVFGTTSFTKGRIRVDHTAGKVPVFEVYAVTEAAGPAQAPIVMSFDDGYANAYTLGAPTLEKYGLRGCFGLIADNVGTSGVYMTWAQARDLVARGHEIVVHGPLGGSGSLRNYDASPTRAADIAADLAYHRDRILAEGCSTNGSHRVYVYPQGENQKDFADMVIRDAVRNAGFRVMRGVDINREDTMLPMGSGMLEYVSIVAHAWVSEGTEVANITNINTRVTNNVAADRPSVMMFHYVVAGTPVQSLEIKQSNLELICQNAANLIAAGTAKNMTFTELYEASTGYRLAVAP